MNGGGIPQSRKNQKKVKNLKEELKKRGNVVAKLTNKQRDEQITWLTSQVTNMSRLLATYIEYKGDSVDFQKHLIDLNEEIKKKAQNDTNNTSKVDSKEG